ncbi:LPXTG cell wall anchor domain-containing protein [Sphingobacterium tabacisoli]|uniref:LPXTG cell wall anchor domain-containing protein n=1 Tax=Sphingobacterium tabacisoli TaxID=2044855 RepID=A0ABW5L285_9SPHI|nr:LPXTG cell wall anchor domain-containing protein [Sphingobacterium tabacisoli]
MTKTKEVFDMRPKTIIIAILLAIVVIILFNNKEESTFWFFGEIRTSKLILLAAFYVLGMITGGILFRRRKKHPKEYAITNPNIPTTVITDTDSTTSSPYAPTALSDEDREFIRRD